jgi:hypothetical protein
MEILKRFSRCWYGKAYQQHFMIYNVGEQHTTLAKSDAKTNKEGNKESLVFRASVAKIVCSS